MIITYKWKEWHSNTISLNSFLIIWITRRLRETMILSVYPGRNFKIKLEAEICVVSSKTAQYRITVCCHPDFKFHLQCQQRTAGQSLKHYSCFCSLVAISLCCGSSWGQLISKFVPVPSLLVPVSLSCSKINQLHILSYPCFLKWVYCLRLLNTYQKRWIPSQKCSCLNSTKSQS